MARSIFFGSVVVCLLCVGVSQVSDPSAFGIHEEPERIMFYAGSGLFAGLSGLLAVVSGIYLTATHFESVSDGQRRFMMTLVLIVVIAVLVAVVIRLNPSF